MNEYTTKIIVNENGNPNSDISSFYETNKIVIQEDSFSLNSSFSVVQSTTSRTSKQIGSGMALRINQINDLGIQNTLTVTDSIIPTVETIRNRKIWPSAPRFYDQDIQILNFGGFGCPDIGLTTTNGAPSIGSVVAETDDAFLIPSYALSAPSNITDENYQNATIDEIEAGLRSYIQNTNGLSSYLNNGTFGKIILDIEYPRNLAQARNITSTDIIWFVNGLIKRIEAARRVLPNAKLGLYGAGTPHPTGASSDDLGRQLQASQLGYTQYIDFICPVMYARFGSGQQTGGDPDPSYQTVLNGNSVSQMKSICDAILFMHSALGFTNTVDIYPLMSFRIYNGNSFYNLQEADVELNLAVMGHMTKSPLPESGYQIEKVIYWVSPDPPDGIRWGQDNIDILEGACNVSEPVIPIRSKFFEQTQIPTSEVGGFAYWALATYSSWTDAVDREFRDGNISETFPEDDPTTPQDEYLEARKRYIPTSKDQFERMIFSGVSDDGVVDLNNNYPSFMKNIIELHDEYILQNGWAVPEDDMAILDFEFHAIFYTLQINFLRLWRDDSYSGSGNVNPGGTIISPCPTGASKRYQLDASPHYPDDEWQDIWFPRLIKAIKRMAQIFRKRYGFKKIGMYGIGGYAGWWEGLTESNNPPESPYTHRGWMKWTWRRILKQWENEGIFRESSRGQGDYLDFITCLPKTEHPNDGTNRYWAFPIDYQRGFEVVIREMTDAYRPWKDNTLLMVNPYHSFSDVDCSDDCLWDQSWSNDYSRQRLQLKYRQNPPDYVDPSNVDNPPALDQELAKLLPLYFKYASDWDTVDFNFYWVDFYRWTSLSTNSKTRYWLLGYDGDFSDENDAYEFAFLKLYCPWYRDLYKQFITFSADKRPMMLINYASSTGVESTGVNAIDHWKINRTPTDSLGRSILRKANPLGGEVEMSDDEDGIKWLVNNHFEPAYQKGIRRFALRNPNGSRTGSESRGQAVPSASWSAADINYNKFNDGVNIRDFYLTTPNGTSVQTTVEGYEYPFTDTGYLVSQEILEEENPIQSVQKNRQESFSLYLKPWIESKKLINDPVDVYIYDGYQFAFFDENQTIPARGNLAMHLYSDNTWQNNEWARRRFPIPDFSKESHVEYRDGEVLPWMQVGISGFIVDASGNALTPGHASESRGYFDYYRQKDITAMGEAVPMINNSGVFSFNEESVNSNSYMGYYSNPGSLGDLWGFRRWDDKTPDKKSEIHIVLVWGWLGNGGWSEIYWDDETQTYDIDSMKAEIDEMVNAGYVVSAGFAPYHSSSPAVEFTARLEIINYIASIQPKLPT